MHNNKTNSDGRFSKIPLGIKTPKMLEVEKRLGCYLEEDFKEYYDKKNWSQKKMAERWQVPRGLIFQDVKRGNKISWVTRLNLIKKPEGKPDNSKKHFCEICEVSFPSLQKAHWISHKEGGSTNYYNILELCPNCHHRLDKYDEGTDKALITLFSRSMKTFFAKGNFSFDEKREALKIANQIIKRKI